MYKSLIFLLLSVALKAQQIPPPLINTELEDCFACLEAKNIKCTNGATAAQINQFIKDENCWYQFYMDKLQELDCVLEENLNQQQLTEDDRETQLYAKMMEVRYNFYNTTQLLEDHICSNCTKNNSFTKYANCMRDYWSNMKTKAETEITANKNAESADIYKRCDTLGRKHQFFCPKKM